MVRSMYLQIAWSALLVIALAATISIFSFNRNPALTLSSISTVKPCHSRRPPPSPRSRRGSWIGNWWIPPEGWRLYSAMEMRDTFQHLSVLWIGDSTSRRAGTTLYYILDHFNSSAAMLPKKLDDPKVIDVNKKRVTEKCTKWVANSTLHPPSLCRTMPGADTKDYLFLSKNCFSEIGIFVRDELSGASNITANVDVIILSMGIWHVARPWDCRKPDQSTNDMINDALDALYEFQRQRPNVTIIWRTTNYSEKNPPKASRDINEYIMNHIDKYQTNVPTGQSMLTYVDWGTDVRPRTAGDGRVPADLFVHTGLEPRLALVQMITNTVKEYSPHESLPSSGVDPCIGTDSDKSASKQNR